MIQNKFIWVLIVLIVGVTALGAPIQDEIKINDEDILDPIVGDVRNNITEQEYDTITQSIKEAESMYYATDFEKIARYVALSAQEPYTFKWNVYVHEGRIRQIGFSNSATKLKKYLVLMNYGKYNLTYTMIGLNDIVCAKINQYNGGSNPAQFGPTMNATDQQTILQAVDHAILYKGNDIMANAAIIQDAATKGVGFGTWTVIIADPSARYGYYICMVTLEKWFALRAYKDFKWNYFGSVHFG